MAADNPYLLDTNVVLLATRQNSAAAKVIDAQFGLSTTRFRPAISEVSVGELYAFTLSQKWGEKRKALLNEQIERCLVIPIAHPGIYLRWAEMASALRERGTPIGQNDLWIAATASITGLTLLTTDRDFSSLVATHQLGTVMLDPTTGIEYP